MSVKNDFLVSSIPVHDASAKFSSSILNGNINQLGDFDQCMDVQAPDEAYRGKYCLTYLQAEVPSNAKKLKHLHTLVQSHSLFRSQLEDVSLYLSLSEKKPVIPSKCNDLCLFAVSAK
jgi:Nose resistant-to-fluoxetine protein, N-terminal domain